MLEVKKFNSKAAISRLIALGIGVLISLSTTKEPTRSVNDRGSFFIASNPSSEPIGDVLNHAIQGSQKSIDIQIYALNDPKTLDYLRHQSKKADVSIYYDASATKNLFEKLGPSTHLHPYSKQGLMHRKITSIDDSLVLFGSNNYTTSSLYWHYNLLIGVRSKELTHFFKTKKLGSKTFEFGQAFLLPDIKNKALHATCDYLKNAEKSIHLGMFCLTHPYIIKELKEAQERGVKIYLYLDKLNFKNLRPDLLHLMRKCEKVFKQTSQVLMHHKFCLIDDKILITGSTNWTKSGFKKNEEVLVIFDKIETTNLKPLQEVIETLEKTLESVSIDSLAA